MTNTRLAEFNINSFVRVRLTDHGRYLLDNAEPFQIHYEEDKDGWSRWQMWQLMSALGSEMYNGCKVPFLPTVLLEFSG